MSLDTTAMVTLLQASPATKSPVTLALHLIGDVSTTGGGGRWDTTDRARRRSVITWSGTDLHQLAIPLQLDGMETAVGADRSVEDDANLLWAWTQPTTAGEPAKVLLSGPLWQPPYRPWWVVADLDWGAAIRRDDGQRIQQDVTVTLREHLAPSVLVGPAAAARARAGV